MATVSLQLSSTPPQSRGQTPVSVANDREALDRAASIIRKYATGAVAITGDSTLRVDLDTVDWRCEARERARRVASLAAEWTGRKVDVRFDPVQQPGEETADPFAVELQRRESEEPGAFTARIARAGQRLQTLVEGSGRQAERWTLHIDRAGRSTSMPLPSSVFEGGTDGLVRRLPPAAMEQVTAVRLESRTRKAPSTHRPGTRSPRPVRVPGRPETLPLVS